MPGDRRLARGELGSKTRDFSAPAKHAAPDPGTMLRKRLREEMEAIQGILKKAELLVRSSKDVNQGRAAPRRGKDGRFVAAEATTKKVDRAPCAKKQETMPPPPVEVIEPQIMDADRVPCAKKMKMAPSVEIVKPRIVEEIVKPQIVEVNQTPCAKKMKTAPSVEIIRPRIVEEIIKPQIVEVNQTPCAKKMKRAPSVEIVKPQIMEEIIKPQIVEEIIKPLIVEVNQTPCAKKRKIVPTVEIIEPQVSEDEVFSLIDRLSMFGSDMPVPILEFLNKECTGHPNEKAGEILINLGSMRRSAMFELLKLLDEFGEEEKCRQQKEEPKNECKSINLSLKRELEDGEVIEEEEEPIIICDDVCPIATKLAEITNSPSNSSSSSSSGSSSSSSSSSSGSSSSSSSSSGSSSSSNTSSGSSCSDSSDSDSSESDSDDECVTSNPAPVVLRQTGTSPTAMAHKLLSPVAEEEFGETRNNQSSCSSLHEEGEIEEQECHVAAEKFAETVNSEPMEPQPGAQGKAHDLYARAFEKTRERRRAYEKLEEMERNAKPIFDCIPPRHLRQLGITPSVEYAVTSERCARTCDSPVQSLLGFFLKAE